MFQLRLISREQPKYFSLAFDICNYNISDSGVKVQSMTNKILVHWATYLVSLDADEEVISKKIIEKLSNVPGVSYSEIARVAYEKHRERLALSLFDREPKAHEQVAALMGMVRRKIGYSTYNTYMISYTHTCTRAGSMISQSSLNLLLLKLFKVEIQILHILHL